MSPTSQFTGTKPRVHVITNKAGKLVLLLSSNGKTKGCLRLAEKNVLIGSSPDCAVCLQSEWVKDFQCQIIQGEHHTMIRNLSPDTRLNDQLFTEAWLEPGDRISCGPIEISILELSSRSKQQPSPKMGEEFDTASNRQDVSYEDLEQLQRQAVELRQSLEHERARSQQRVKELESNLLASRDHLRYAREQLIALRGRRLEQHDHSAGFVEAPVVIEEKFDCDQNFLTADAHCEVKPSETEDLHLELTVSANQNTNRRPNNSRTDSEELDLAESVEDFSEATDRLPGLGDFFAPSKQTVPVEAESQASHDDENIAEADGEAASLKAWFDPQTTAADLERTADLSTNLDQVKCELPEHLMNIVREGEQVTAPIESESKNESVAPAIDVVCEQHDLTESDRVVIEEGQPEVAESENTRKGRKLAGRILTLFGKGTTSPAPFDELSQQSSCSERLDSIQEAAAVLPAAGEQDCSESLAGQADNLCDEEFELTSDWKSFLAEYQPQAKDCTMDQGIAVDNEAEEACVPERADEQTSCLESESMRIPDLATDAGLEESVRTEELSTITAQLEEAEMDGSEATKTPERGADDELQASYERVLDSLSTPHEEVNETVGVIGGEDVAIDRPAMIDESKEEESIEDYMNKLLNRVGVCRQSRQPAPSQIDFDDTAEEVPPAEEIPQPEELLVKTFSQDLESRKRELGSVEIACKSLPALETDHLDEMRLMARESAYSAIEASLRRKTSSQATVQLGIGCFLLVAGIVQTTLADGLTIASVLSTMPCYAASAYFFMKYFDWRKSFTSLDAKLTNEAG